jgi:signal transduction histidine kinase
MSAASAKSTQQSLTSFEDRYRATLAEYVANPNEDVLRRAYDLGRQAVDEGKSLLEMTSLHQDELLALMGAARDRQAAMEVSRMAAEFLNESFSPYEMAHRGFQDAVRALRQVNEKLENEISRIAYAVHDEAGQMLAAVHLALAELGTKLNKAQQDHIGRMEQMLLDVERQLRRFSHELRPTILDELGWIPAIEFLSEGVTKRSKLPIRIEAEVEQRLPRPVETALYRVVQEALTNITKHAKANRVEIKIRPKGELMTCSILDDGEGFDVAAIEADRNRRGLGLFGMKERLDAVGGRFQIESAPGKGTELLIQVPLTDPRKE